MRRNQIKHKMAAGQPVYGMMIQFPDADLVEMMGHAGFDWILIDAEHGSINANDCANLVRACELSDATSIVRPPCNDPHVILRFMDRGAQGVQVPHVNTVAEARAAVEAVKYYPMGKRGVTSAARSAGYGLLEPIPESIRSSNEETLVCVMIEEQRAMRELREMVKVEGIDVFFVGAGDMAQSMGHPGVRGVPEVVKVVDEALDIILSAGREAGLSGDEERTPDMVRRGVKYFHTGLTPFVKFGARHYWNLIGEQRVR